MRYEELRKSIQHLLREEQIAKLQEHIDKYAKYAPKTPAAQARMAAQQRNWKIKQLRGVQALVQTLDDVELLAAAEAAEGRVKAQWIISKQLDKIWQTGEKMLFQFQVDGRAFGAPLRANWKDAAQDAVNAGYANWSNGGIRMNDQCEIARINQEQKSCQSK